MAYQHLREVSASHIHNGGVSINSFIIPFLRAGESINIHTAEKEQAKRSTAVQVTINYFTCTHQNEKIGAFIARVTPIRPTEGNRKRCVCIHGSGAVDQYDFVVCTASKQERTDAHSHSSTR
jgi:hypothetical protein